MVAVWSRLHNLVKSFICLVVLVSAIVIEYKFVNEPKIESVSVILNKDKETVYKGGTSYIMCLQQIKDKKIFSLNVGYSTYSLFEKGDTITFKLRPNQIYEETVSKILTKNISLIFTMIVVLFLAIYAIGCIVVWANKKYSI